MSTMFSKLSFLLYVEKRLYYGGRERYPRETVGGVGNSFSENHTMT